RPWLLHLDLRASVGAGHPPAGGAARTLRAGLVHGAGGGEIPAWAVARRPAARRRRAARRDRRRPARLRGHARRPRFAYPGAFSIALSTDLRFALRRS